MAVGFQRVTADGVIGASGKPIAVYGYAITSGGTAGVITLRNGDAVGDGIAWQDYGIVNSHRVVSFPTGVVLPDGLFLDVDANVSACTVFYEQVKS